MGQFSQNAEEDFILDYFRDQPTGRFIDIGAYDVERFSNTRALYLKGWKGIFVEPAPVQFNKIYEHYKEDSGILTLNMAVGETNGEIDFYESEDAVSTTDEAHMTKWNKAGVAFNKIKVAQIKTADFFEEHCKSIDMVTIDTEATNYAVFKAIPDFVFEQVKLFVIEHDGHFEEMQDKLADFGFYTLYFNGENLLCAK